MSSNAVSIPLLLEKMVSNDSDYRYMATNDLMTELSKPSFQMEEITERKIVQMVIKLLQDKNGEVQNLTVKCLVPLVKKVREQQVQDIFESICQLLLQKKDDSRDIASMALKTVVMELPADSSAPVLKRLIPRLVSLLKSNVQELLMDTLDILSEVLSRFGQVLAAPTTTTTSTTNANAAADTTNLQQHQKFIQETLLPLLNHSRQAIRKKATIALGNLVMYIPDDLFQDIMSRLLIELKEKEKSKDYDKLRTFIGCVATMSRFSSQRMGKHLNDLVPMVLKYAGFDDDELREICLQALESFVLRCPTEITAHIRTVISLALQYIKYDPNYAASDDDDDMEGGEDDADEEMKDVDDEDDQEDEEEEEEEDEDDDVDYSDDEDMSWKVRRASSKLLTSVIATRSELLSDLYVTVAPTLINRFKEREESVRVDILSTFITLVRQTGSVSGTNGRGNNHQQEQHQELPPRETKKRRGGNTASTSASASASAEKTPLDHLSSLIPKLCKSLAKQLAGKSIPTRQTGFNLLVQVITVLDGGLDSTLHLFIPVIESSLSSSTAHPSKTGTNTNLKIDTLVFLRNLFITHPSTVFQKHLGRFVKPILVAANDKFYKITSEALSVLGELIQIIRPIAYDAASNQYTISPIADSKASLGYIQDIYKVILSRLQKTDVDMEVKERAIQCLGTLLSQAGDLVTPRSDIPNIVLPLLLERLRNEFTRLTTVKVVTKIADSPLAGPSSVSSSAAIDLSPILPEMVPEIASFLRKSHRQIRVASLTALETLIRRYGKSPQFQASLYPAILVELKPLVADADLHILPLAMSVLVALVYNGHSPSNPQVLNMVRSEIVPALAALVHDQPHLVSAGNGLESLLNVWQCLVRVGGSSVFSECASLLTNDIENKSKQSFSTIAQSIATLCLNSEKDCPATVKEFISKVESKTSGTGNENAKYLALLALGEIGRKIDLSNTTPSAAKLHTTLLNLFGAPSEEIKHAAAFALGNIAVGNLGQYMPIVLQAVQEGGGKKRYLVLVALKEIISRHAQSDKSSLLKPFVKDLKRLLFEHCQQDVSLEESTRTVIAECLGKLSLSDPVSFLPELQKKLHAAQPGVRATVVAAIRYTFAAGASGAVVGGEHDHERTGAQDYDSLLRPMIVDFLKLMKDDDLNVRRSSLATLNAAAHNKPHLIRDSLTQLLPLLYEETNVREELIHIVEMGPFKHRVDDGLEIRKLAYECMYTLLETCMNKLDIFVFIARVIHGLNDPAQEIKMLTHLMMQRLAVVSPTAVLTKLDETVEPLKATLNTKPKPNAVKQELEKMNELVRSAARTVLVLSSRVGAGVATADGSVKFEAFVAEVTATSSPLKPVFDALAMENDGNASGGGGVAPMDLS